MVDERARAISITNRYFVLADGMIPGFKDHLAEDVILKWFGQVIKGKENVAAFISNRKFFHRFSDITPISGIFCKSKRYWKSKQLDMNAKCDTYTNNDLREAYSPCKVEMSTIHEKDYRQKNNANYMTSYEANNEFSVEKCIDKLKTSIDHDKANNFNANQNKFSANAIAEIDDQCCDLNKNKLYNLFEPEITSQPIVGKIQSINRIKLKEEMAPTVGAINREYGQGDGSVIAEANATKYLEANGEIKYVRFNADTSDSSLLYYSSEFRKKKFWKRQCKLQIAYSFLDNNNLPEVTTKCYSVQKNTSTRVSKCSVKICHDINKIQENKLPSLEEAIQVANTLIRDVNHFGGYLQPLNFSEDRENFLKSFEAKLAEKNPNICARYVNNKLNFDFPNIKPFNVEYQIHKIIYSSVKKNAFNVQETAGANNDHMSYQ